MRRWQWTYNGFHGRATLAVMVPDDADDGDLLVVSRRVARRLNAAVCPVPGCTCGEEVAFPGEGWLDYVILEERGSEQRGRHPQD